MLVADAERVGKIVGRHPVDRCFHCKAELMEVVAPIAARNDAVIALGVNVDDLGDHRPGQRAASEAGGVPPGCLM